MKKILYILVFSLLLCNNGLAKKYINRSKKYLVHDENNKFKTGEAVTIQENKPISKTKKWIVVN